MFFAARRCIEAELGPPRLDGIWRTIGVDSPGVDFRVSIWCHGTGLLLLQQDDYQHLQFPEMVGLEVDICVLNFDLDRELPRRRTWRLRGEGT